MRWKVHGWLGYDILSIFFIALLQPVNGSIL